MAREAGMASEEWAPYIAAWRERHRRAAEELEQRVEAGRTTARKCARVVNERNFNTLRADTGRELIDLQ